MVDEKEETIMTALFSVGVVDDKNTLYFMDKPICDVIFNYNMKMEFLIALVDSLNKHETECSNAT